MRTTFCSLSPLITTHRLNLGMTYLAHRGINAMKTMTGKSMELKLRVPADITPERAEELTKNAFAGTGAVVMAPAEIAR